MNQNHPSHFYFGILTKPVGLHGDLQLAMDVDDASRYKKIKSVFLELNGGLVPFSIEKISIKDNKHASVKLEGVNDSASAAGFSQTAVFLPSSLLPPLTGNKFYFHEVIGFTVIDHEAGEIGKIEKILDFPHQDLFLIKKNYRDVLIPINDDTIEKVDRENGTIFIKAPVGLIDIYLSEQKPEDEDF